MKKDKKPEHLNRTGESAEGESRREMLKSVGKYALYTPPIIMALMAPSRTAFAGTGAVDPEPNDPTPF
jgi:hypothetical protein